MNHNYPSSVKEFLAQTFHDRALPFVCIALITVPLSTLIPVCVCSYELLLSSGVPCLWIRAGCRFKARSASVTDVLLETCLYLSALVAGAKE
jgi:hypothetical protein